MYSAILQNHVECMKKIREKKVSFCGGMLNLAAENGRLDCLKYMYENRKNNDVY